ncbi:M23 family metallopeptidase [Entomospira nematocerorum]|uniref:M23 family metallopeptidase n=1 Tax=Entomospira nematocerorum TaxID=2719987 RepID=A0A968GE25_9SPIO|nr:M23 family metallopeptidase [Entomospira nematocera]NIZ46585.1 M23 family metallopeptidase [Entomospira nematocera]WDI33617.1 M23 family metallopeptidase [Entomospira nematocera]
MTAIMLKPLVSHIFLIMLVSFTAYTQETIQFLSKEDPNFARAIQEIDTNYQRIAQKKEILPLNFYFYRVKDGESIYTIAARFNLNYDSIASVNQIASPQLLESNQIIIIPNLPALYLREDSEEALFQSALNRLQESPYFNAVYTEQITEHDIYMRVYSNQKFSPQERLTFMSGFFLWPITGVRIITSDYGKRLDPIAHQSYHHHNGIDLRLASGSPVYASRTGTVTYTGYNNVLGYHVILQHAQGFETIYGHLTKYLVHIGQMVHAGEHIAISGNSGLSTGPHLHFEIRKNGIPVDPKPFFMSS